MAAVSKVSVDTEVKIDKNDLITVYVSRAEVAMQGSLNHALSQIKSIEKHIKSDEVLLNKNVDAAGNEFAKDILESLKAGFAAFGGMVAHISAIKLCKESNKINVYINIRKSSTDYDYRGNMDMPVLSLPLNDDLKAQLGNIAFLKNEKAKFEEEAVTMKRKLAQLPSLERRYRAQMVENQLSKSEDGKALLDSIVIDLNADVLSLPG